MVGCYEGLEGPGAHSVAAGTGGLPPTIEVEKFAQVSRGGSWSSAGLGS